MKSTLGLFQTFILDNSKQAQIQQIIKSASNELALIRLHLWRIFFGIYPLDSTPLEKIHALQNARKAFNPATFQQKDQQVKQKPKTAGPLGPLSVSPGIKQKISSISDQRQLRDQIKKDVNRTYQELAFFREASTKKLMEDVLFVYGKLNPSIGYQQGMHQILAAVIHIYFQEICQEDQLYKQFVSEEYATADCFSLFDAIMKAGHFKMFLFQNDKKGDLNPNSKNQQPILQRITKLQDHQFKILDIQLFRHIKLQEVQTRPFLLRWIRCMHTREMDLQKALIFWDNIFLEFFLNKEPGLPFLNSTCMALLSYLRQSVLRKDQSHMILQLYQNYPKLNSQQIKQIIGLAWNFNEILRSGETVTSDPLNVRKKDLFLFNKGFADKEPVKLRDFIPNVSCSSGQRPKIVAKKGIPTFLHQILTAESRASSAYQVGVKAYFQNERSSAIGSPSVQN